MAKLYIKEEELNVSCYPFSICATGGQGFLTINDKKELAVKMIHSGMLPIEVFLSPPDQPEPVQETLL